MFFFYRIRGGPRGQIQAGGTAIPLSGVKIAILIETDWSQKMAQTREISPPHHLPFLEALCWQTENVKHLTPQEMLDRYERGWLYKGVLAELEGEELTFLRKLAKAEGSWIATSV